MHLHSARPVVSQGIAAGLSIQVGLVKCENSRTWFEAEAASWTTQAVGDVIASCLVYIFADGAFFTAVDVPAPVLLPVAPFRAIEALLNVQVVLISVRAWIAFLHHSIVTGEARLAAQVGDLATIVAFEVRQHGHVVVPRGVMESVRVVTPIHARLKRVFFHDARRLRGRAGGGRWCWCWASRSVRGIGV